ncbi:MAG: radical SAM protein [Archaeoglobaceae archaeon]|nr:radical SAM protein [Archaeoglobaceae archaeon]
MQYDFPEIRPPSEAGSYLLRVTRGCAWKKCVFCWRYGGTKFEIRNVNEIKKDILRMREIFGYTTSAFIGDADPLVHKHLDEIIRFLKQNYPHVSRVTAYARAKTIAKMKEERLKRLKESGLTRLHIGLESGDDEILKLMKKGATSEDMIKAGLKTKKFFELSFYVIVGLGGIERSKQHVINTSKVINEVAPDFVRVRTLTIGYNNEIVDMVEEGVLTPLTPIQQLEELERLVKSIEVKTYFTCDHISNYLVLDGADWFNRIIFKGVEGILPNERERMIKEIRKAKEIVKNLKNKGVRILNCNDLIKLGVIM